MCSQVASVICDSPVASVICDSQIVKLLDTRFNKERRERREKKGKKERLWRHTETPMTTPPIPLERYQRDESNNTKKGHQR
jgi:hypothetical protein